MKPVADSRAGFRLRSQVPTRRRVARPAAGAADNLWTVIPIMEGCTGLRGGGPSASRLNVDPFSPRHANALNG